MNNAINIALVGASGVVGSKIISLLEKKNININNFYPLGSSSVGKEVSFKSKTYIIEDLSDFDSSKVHLAIFSAGSKVAKEYANEFVSNGAYVIDLSSEFRYDEDVPLIIPEINGNILKDVKKPLLIANPNCSVSQLLMAIEPIHKNFDVDLLNIATYQAVSGTGKDAVKELNTQLEDSNAEAKVYPKKIAFNVIPQCDIFLENDYGNQPMIYLGEMTARRLNVNEGDIVRLLSPIDHGYTLGLPIQIQCVVGGIFNIQVLDLDDKIAFIPYEIGQKLFIRKNQPDGIDIRLAKGHKIELVANELKQELKRAKVETWGELHEELFGAMKFERVGTLAVLSLIIVVACFNLVTTLVLQTAQKAREFGILQVLGSNQRAIKSIIMYQGVLISSLGIISGLILGLFIIFFQNIFGFIPLPEDIYFTSHLPMVIQIKDIIAILIIPFGMVITSIYISTKRTIVLSSIKSIFLDK